MSTEIPENTNISSAQQFKQRREQRDKGEVIELTSGLSVLLRRPDVTKLIAEDLIPADLVQVFLDMQSQTSTSMKPEQIVKLMGFQRVVATHALIQPKVVDEPDYDKGEIAITDIDQSDLDDIWQYVQGGAEAVKSFREQRNQLLSGQTVPSLSE